MSIIDKNNNNKRKRESTDLIKNSDNNTNLNDADRVVQSINDIDYSNL